MGDCHNVPLQTATYEPDIEPTTTVDKLRRRLKTYSHWTSKKSSLQLATAGFIYTGITDKVECQSCGIRLYNWQGDEDPLHAHKQYAPDCEFMLKNFPQIKTPPKPTSPTVKYTHYSDYESRLRSFDSWPLKCVAQKPDMMARCGFFYIGSADRARCFHCGVTLRDWDTDDYPPCAHQKWSEHCPYVRQLDIDGMKAEIEEWEREERDELEFENSGFTDCSSSQRELCSSGGGEEKQVSEVSSNSHNTPAVQAVAEMGYSLDLIMKVVDSRKVAGFDNPTGEQLMETLMDME